jgi:hypothetical protein
MLVRATGCRDGGSAQTDKKRSFCGFVPWGMPQNLITREHYCMKITKDWGASFLEANSWKNEVE